MRLLAEQDCKLITKQSANANTKLISPSVVVASLVVAIAPALTLVIPSTQPKWTHTSVS